MDSIKPSTTATTSQLEAHLEDISEAIVQEFNRRPLSRSSPTWENMSCDFKANYDCPLTPHQEPMTLDQWILSVENIVESNPHYRVEIVDKTPYVHPHSNQAEVIVVFKMSGFAQTDTVMQVMGTFKFGYMDMRWQCRSYDGIGEMLVPVGDVETASHQSAKVTQTKRPDAATLSI